MDESTTILVWCTSLIVYICYWVTYLALQNIMRDANSSFGEPSNHGKLQHVNSSFPYVPTRRGKFILCCLWMGLAGVVSVFATMDGRTSFASDAVRHPELTIGIFLAGAIVGGTIQYHTIADAKFKFLLSRRLVWSGLYGSLSALIAMLLCVMLGNLLAVFQKMDFEGSADSIAGIPTNFADLLSSTFIDPLFGFSILVGFGILGPRLAVAGFVSGFILQHIWSLIHVEPLRD